MVEQRRPALDDADLVERSCPELKTVRILKAIDENGKAETVAKKNRITLRMSLNRTGMALKCLCSVVALLLTGSKVGFEYDAAIRGSKSSKDAL